MKSHVCNDEISTLWQQFKKQFSLTEKQLHQFQTYCELLQDWNKKINLTAITDSASIIADHFQDSLMVRSYIDFSTISMIADVGTGAGFPGIPLKILYPHLSVVLIEVIQKKINFLHMVTEQLELDNCYVDSLDWRTFLRKTDYPVELFLARASLSVDELLRMFKQSSAYHNAQLIYWASYTFSIPEYAQPLVKKDQPYTVHNKKRRYIFFRAN